MKQQIEAYINERIFSQDFEDFIGDSLMKICIVDNTPSSSISDLAQREQKTFEIIRDILVDLNLPGDFSLYPVEHDIIRKHPSYTPIFYTEEKEPYKGRSNMIFHLVPEKVSELGRRLAFNAHIDTVAPHFAPVRDGSVITGRGSCDDKGSIAVMIGVLKILSELAEKFDLVPANEMTFMFVIDEETGGNGSLSLAINNELRKRYDGLIVLECCSNQAYPANRGALWYKAELPLGSIPKPALASAELILALEDEGKKIYDESDHPMFVDRPVQTCHGMIGPWGEHPSRICGYIEYQVKTDKTEALLLPIIDEAVSRYTKRYGDKTKVFNGRPAVVDLHYKLQSNEDGFLLKVYGSTGHMAAIHLNDGALTKAAYIITDLYQKGGDIDVLIGNFTDNELLVMEGGQSFLPVHTIRQIKARMKDAGFVVLEKYGISRAQVESILTMDKLHNAAFCSDSDTALFDSVRKALESQKLEQNLPVRGWGASCDSRLFWEESPELPIVTAGAGQLDDAHADDEKVNLKDLCKNIAALTLVSLEYTDSLL